MANKVDAWMYTTIIWGCSDMIMILCRASEKNFTIWRFTAWNDITPKSLNFISMYICNLQVTNTYIKYIYKSSQMLFGALLGGPGGFHHPWGHTAHTKQLAFWKICRPWFQESGICPEKDATNNFSNFQSWSLHPFGPCKRYEFYI